MTSREMALAAYRQILRSTRLAFQGDLPTFLASRQAARDGFEQNRALAPDSRELAEGIQHARDVAKILRENVVQGVPDERSGRYKLRIHEHTERGDNESIKTAGGKGQNLAAHCGCS